jgi:hypothetical protein
VSRLDAMKAPITVTTQTIIAENTKLGRPELDDLKQFPAVRRG